MCSDNARNDIAPCSCEPVSSNRKGNLALWCEKSPSTFNPFIKTTHQLWRTKGHITGINLTLVIKTEPDRFQLREKAWWKVQMFDMNLIFRYPCEARLQRKRLKTQQRRYCTDVRRDKEQAERRRKGIIHDGGGVCGGLNLAWSGFTLCSCAYVSPCSSDCCNTKGLREISYCDIPQHASQAQLKAEKHNSPLSLSICFPTILLSFFSFPETQ